MRKGAEPRPSRSCGCSGVVRMDFRRSSCMAIPRPRAAAMQKSSWKATPGIWRPMAIRGTTTCRGSGAVPAGHIRRYFIDAVPKGKQYDYSQPAVQGVQYCNRLFAIEVQKPTRYQSGITKKLETNRSRPQAKISLIFRKIFICCRQ